MKWKADKIWFHKTYRAHLMQQHSKETNKILGTGQNFIEKKKKKKKKILLYIIKQKLIFFSFILFIVRMHLVKVEKFNDILIFVKIIIYITFTINIRKYIL